VPAVVVVVGVVDVGVEPGEDVGVDDGVDYSTCRSMKIV
jgi:hypothetical protein